MVAPAVAEAAAESGVAQMPIADLARYGSALKRYVADTDTHMREFLASRAS